MRVLGGIFDRRRPPPPRKRPPAVVSPFVPPPVVEVSVEPAPRGTFRKVVLPEPKHPPGSRAKWEEAGWSRSFNQVEGG